MSSDLLSFLGDDKDAFIKSSLAVYTNVDQSGVLKYVGKTNPEKAFSPGFSVAEWWDNTSGTQTLFVIDPDKVDTKITFSFAQVLDPNILAISIHGQLDEEEDPNFNRVYLGSNPGAFREGSWQFIGRGRTGRVVKITFFRAIAVPTGTITLGTPGSYANTPIELRALQDVTKTDTQRDLVRIEIQKIGS